MSLNNRGFFLLELIIGISVLSIIIPHIIMPCIQIQKTLLSYVKTLFISYENHYIYQLLTDDLKHSQSVSIRSGNELHIIASDQKQIRYCLTKDMLKRINGGRTLILTKFQQATQFQPTLLTPNLLEIQIQSNSYRVYIPSQTQIHQ